MLWLPSTSRQWLQTLPHALPTLLYTPVLLQCTWRKTASNCTEYRGKQYTHMCAVQGRGGGGVGGHWWAGANGSVKNWSRLAPALHLSSNIATSSSVSNQIWGAPWNLQAFMQVSYIQNPTSWQFPPERPKELNKRIDKSWGQNFVWHWPSHWNWHWQRICKLWQGECYGEDNDDDVDFIMIMEVLLDHESFHCSLAGAQIYQLPLPHTHCTLCTVYTLHLTLWRTAHGAQRTCTTHTTLNTLYMYNTHSALYTLYTVKCAQGKCTCTLYSTYWSWYIARRTQCTICTCTIHSWRAAHCAQCTIVQHAMYLTHCRIYSTHCACLTLQHYTTTQLRYIW